MSNGKTDEVIEEIFNSFLSSYWNRFGISTKGNDFVIDCVHLVYKKSHEMNLDEGGTYMYSLDWIKNKKATINSINKSEQLLLIFCMLKKKKYILLAFQIITQIT